MTTNMQRALRFMAKHQGWQSYAPDTRRAMTALAKRGWLELSDISLQCRITESGKVAAYRQA